MCEADEHMQSASAQTLREVDLSKMATLSEKIRAVVVRARGSETDMLVLERLEKAQHLLEALGPIVRDLRNPALKERHWTKLERKLESSLRIPEPTAKSETHANVSTINADADAHRLDLLIRDLLKINVVNHGTNIRQVSEEATAEAAVSESFDNVWKTWESKELPIEQRKDRDGRDAASMGDGAELVSLMEESEVLLRVMDFSSYARAVQDRLVKLLGDLALTKTAIELLETCQTRWDYIQQLVSADFVRSFPDQAKLLQKHDTSWRGFMLALTQRPLCLPFGSSVENRQILQEIIMGFDIAVKALAEHLEVPAMLCFVHSIWQLFNYWCNADETPSLPAILSIVERRTRDAAFESAGCARDPAVLAPVL